jgi:hypothetical protein
VLGDGHLIAGGLDGFEDQLWMRTREMRGAVRCDDIRCCDDH